MDFLSTNSEQVFLNVAGAAVFLAIWLYSFSFKIENKIYKNICTGTLVIAFIALTASIAVRGVGLGHIPIRNLYESLVIMAWGLVGSYLFLEWKYDFRKFGAYSSMLVMGLFLYASWLPLDQKDWSPLIPALQSYWRAIHVPPLLVSYGLFLLGGIAGLTYLISHKKNAAILSGSDQNAISTVNKKLEFYEEMTFRCVSFGFPLLTFGIVCGALWANHAWGALWQWDPKETLALFTWFVYAVYIHLRMRGTSPLKTSMVAALGVAAVYITYFGINQFNLGGLHSYGNVE